MDFNRLGVFINLDISFESEICFHYWVVYGWINKEKLHLRSKHKSDTLPLFYQTQKNMALLANYMHFRRDSEIIINGALNMRNKNLQRSYHNLVPK